MDLGLIAVAVIILAVGFICYRGIKWENRDIGKD